MVRQFDVVVLGGGFAGLACAQRLERLWGAEASRRVLLVSSENYFVFQPLLPEVVGAGVAPLHVINPIRIILRYCQVQRAEVAAVDLATRRVEFECTGRPPVEPVEANHLVLALGSSIDLHAVPGMMEHGLFIKNLADAIELRGHIIRRLEEAQAHPDPDERSSLLHFVVVGGGYSGVETAAEVLDLLASARRFYPPLERCEPRVTLIDVRERLLFELDERLGRFAQRSLERRGMTILLNERATAVSANAIHLTSGTRILTKNVICTVGNSQHPVLRRLPVEQHRGRIVTDEFLRAKGFTDVWAIGDCASSPDGHGGTCPPTAQFASRLGTACGRNIAASLSGQPLRPFRYKALGQLATLGYRNGVCYILGIRLSGFIAWWCTRTLHLLKLPGFERRLRVVIDWTLDLFFPRDLNYLDLEKTEVVDRIHVEPGDVLFHQGDRSDTFYVIEEGVIELARRDGTGKVVFREELPAGSHFGEGSLIRDRIRTTTATAVTPADLLVIGPKDFSSLLASCSVLRQAFQDTSYRFRPDDELANAAWPESLLAQLVEEVMAAPVETLADSATIADAFRAVAEHRRGNLPLVDADGRLAGMVTRTDLYRVVADGRNLHGPIADIATRQVTVLAPKQSLREALGILRRKRVKHAPVVDDSGRPIGMLSYLDVALASVRTSPAPSLADATSPSCMSH